MIAKCVQYHNEFHPMVLPPNLGAPTNDYNYVSSSEWFTQDCSGSRPVPQGSVGYKLTVGKDYPVYGMIIYKGQLRYFIGNDDNIPGFFPAELFVPTNHDIPEEWEYKFFSGVDVSVCTIGYPEFSEYQDILGIMREDSSVLSKFSSLKEGIARWSI